MQGAERKGRSEGLVKVTFPLDANAWHGSATETLWAEQVTDSQYRLRNTPFYAYGVGTEDVVFAREQDGRLVFTGVARHGGHSTYRIIKAQGSDPSRFQERWAPLQKLGCSYEEGPGGLLAVDIPPQVDIQVAYSLLEQGEEARVWNFEEGHCGHPLQVQR